MVDGAEVLRRIGAEDYQGAARLYHSVFVADTVREVRRDAQPPERSSEAALTYTWSGTPLGHVEGLIIRLHDAVENEDGKTIVLS